MTMTRIKDFFSTKENEDDSDDGGCNLYDKYATGCVNRTQIVKHSKSCSWCKEHLSLGFIEGCKCFGCDIFKVEHEADIYRTKINAANMIRQYFYFEQIGYPTSDEMKERRNQIFGIVDEYTKLLGITRNEGFGVVLCHALLSR